MRGALCWTMHIPHDGYLAACVYVEPDLLQALRPELHYAQAGEWQQVQLCTSADCSRSMRKLHAESQRLPAIVLCDPQDQLTGADWPMLQNTLLGQGTMEAWMLNNLAEGTHALQALTPEVRPLMHLGFWACLMSHEPSCPCLAGCELA